MLNALYYIPVTVGVCWFWWKVGLWTVANYRQLAQQATTVKARIKDATDAFKGGKNVGG